MPPDVPATVSASVPDVVIGDPATDIKPPVKVCATLVTEPLPLLLNVVQSAADSAPRLTADAVGMLRAITGAVVLLVTLKDTSVPVVASVTLTLETVPPKTIGSV